MALTRTFIAVELSDDAREALQRRIARLQRKLPGVRLADPASLHLTLVFLGELDDDRLNDVIAKSLDAARASRPFSLSLGELGTFGSRRAPRVIWTGVTGDVAPLLSLQQRLASDLESLGFPREERPFSPHLTLARLKQPLAPEIVGQIDALQQAPIPRDERATFAVDHIAVMKSELASSGARYTRLQACPLGNAPE
ncbi:MAG: RNA 2',3'-cyclic phosphodiesterase [Ktedonobacterales bacterium]